MLTFSYIGRFKFSTIRFDDITCLRFHRLQTRINHCRRVMAAVRSAVLDLAYGFDDADLVDPCQQERFAGAVVVMETGAVHDFTQPVYTYEVHPRSHTPGWRLFLLADADEVGGGLFPPGPYGHGLAEEQGRDWLALRSATYPRGADSAGEPIDAQADVQPTVGKSADAARYYPKGHTTSPRVRLEIDLKAASPRSQSWAK